MTPLDVPEVVVDKWSASVSCKPGVGCAGSSTPYVVVDEDNTLLLCPICSEVELSVIGIEVLVRGTTVVVDIETPYPGASSVGTMIGKPVEHEVEDVISEVVVV